MPLILRIAAFLMIMAHAVPAHALAVVQIGNVSDFSFGSWSLGDPAPNAHIDLCVYSVGTQIPSGYAITATGSNGFKLSSGGNQIPYSLYWEDSGAGNLNAGTGSQLSSGVTLTGRTNSNILSPLCALGLAGPTARLTLTITQADMTAALAGTYSGSVTLMVSEN